MLIPSQCVIKKWSVYSYTNIEWKKIYAKNNGHNGQRKKKELKLFRQTEFPFDECSVYLFIFSVVAQQKNTHREYIYNTVGGEKCFRIVCFCCRSVNRNSHSSATIIFSVIDCHYSWHLVLVSSIVFTLFSRVAYPNKSGRHKQEWFVFLFSILSAFLYKNTVKCKLFHRFKQSRRNREAHCRHQQNKRPFLKCGETPVGIRLIHFNFLNTFVFCFDGFFSSPRFQCDDNLKQ